MSGWVSESARACVRVRGECVCQTERERERESEGGRGERGGTHAMIRTGNKRLCFCAGRAGSFEGARYHLTQH